MGKGQDQNQREKAQKHREKAEAIAAEILERAEAIARGEQVSPLPRRNGKKGRTPAQRSIDQYVAVQLSVQGYTGAEIAEAIGISVGLVQDDLKVSNEIFRRRAHEAIEEHRGKHLMITDTLITDLHRSWRQSRGEQTSTTTEARRGTGRDGAGTGGKVVSKKEQSHGDINYVFGIARIMERQAKLAGLDKPQEARIFIEQSQEAIDRVANTLVEELHAENPALLKRLLDRIAEVDGTRPEPIETEAEVVEA